MHSVSPKACSTSYSIPSIKAAQTPALPLTFEVFSRNSRSYPAPNECANMSPLASAIVRDKIEGSAARISLQSVSSSPLRFARFFLLLFLSPIFFRMLYSPRFRLDGPLNLMPELFHG